MAEIDWPWQYSFPPFFTLQPHAETKSKQLLAWRNIILDYFKNNKQTILDVNEAQRTPLFNNPAINRKLPLDAIMYILEDMARTGNAAPIDKSRNKWEIYWHSLEEWGNMIYSWASDNGMINTVCTLFEIVAGDDNIDQEFYGLDQNILIKALKTLEASKRCELIEFDDNQGVKFF